MLIYKSIVYKCTKHMKINKHLQTKHDKNTHTKSGFRMPAVIIDSDLFFLSPLSSTTHTHTKSGFRMPAVITDSDLIFPSPLSSTGACSRWAKMASRGSCCRMDTMSFSCRYSHAWDGSSSWGSARIWNGKWLSPLIHHTHRHTRN